MQTGEHSMREFSDASRVFAAIEKSVVPCWAG